MEYFASITAGELNVLLGGFLGVIVALLGGFYGFSQKQSKEARSERTEERKEFTKALKDLTVSNREIADATKQGAKEAEQRNGHLAELTIEARKDVMNMLGVMLTDLKDQNVQNQVVEHQHIESKE